MALDFLPGQVLPGHHQGGTLRFGSLPLTHRFTFQDTGPTLAYPGRYSWRSLLRASSSPLASGWHLLRGGAQPHREPLEVTPFPVSMVHIRRAVLSTGFLWQCMPVNRRGCRRRILCLLAPACQPLALGNTHDGSSHLRLRCPSMRARRDTRMKAARLRRLSPLQTLEDQSQAWGICCHSCTGREGLVPSWKTELQSLALCGLPEDSILFRPTGHTGRSVAASDRQQSGRTLNGYPLAGGLCEPHHGQAPRQRGAGNHEMSWPGVGLTPGASQ
jgi:hypothetical protein